MITVRFPNGFSIQYNDLHAQWTNDGGHLLYETSKDRDSGKGWRVAVPKECVVELVRPCRTYNACQADYNDQRLAAVEKEMRTLKAAVRKSMRKESGK